MFGTPYEKTKEMADRRQSLVERNTALNAALEYMRTTQPNGDYHPEDVVRTAFVFYAYLRHGMMTTYGPQVSESTEDGQAESAS